MAGKLEKAAVERFLEYVSYGTGSDSASDTCPSTNGQRELAKLLYRQLSRMGADEVTLTEKGYVYSYFKGNRREGSVGFIAHMDTSPDFRGDGVKPRIVEYCGGEIVLNGVVALSPAKFPQMNKYVGERLIVTDGTTLLGADDKAGIAEIMTALEYAVENIAVRPDIYAAFTPDEEIGRGMDNFDLSLFKPDYAYTVDGGGEGELEYECFNAARAVITITGEAVHPGYAKGVMKNAALIATEFIEALPKGQTPAETEGREGFFHVVSVNGSVAEAKIDIIIRDFDESGFMERKKLLESHAHELNTRRGGALKLVIKDEYRNMHEIIAKNMEVVEIAKSAYDAAGVAPVIKPIRGGTDGSRLTFMGIPCPNIFAGGHNFHGPYEFIPVKSMGKAADVILNIIKFSRG